MTVLFILSSTTAIVVSFLCSLAEALLLSLNPLTLHRMQNIRPRAAESWKRLKKNVTRPITAILVLNTVAHTGGATVAGGAFVNIYGEQYVWIFSILFTVIVLFGTELLPKIIGVTFRNQLAPSAGHILELITKLMHPLVKLSEFMFRRLSPEYESEQITTADIITLATLARSGKAINLEQENIIVNAVRLSHTLMSHAMIPPDRIIFIRKGDNPESILELARKSGYSRYPVSSSQDVKDIFAFVTIKKAIPASKEEISTLIEKATPIHTVNKNKTLMTALHTMLENKEHLLSVVDDRNKCIGIVTLEDIAGELLSADIELFR
ncbi:MAG: CNNM domain-containing protein [Candidatus Auribacterota bacterium]|jgi:CBS domain containing-hemolysin-like protein|nr:CNNM domain-containing protein [Candidatus Auribacterota bacterium]